MGGRTQSEDLGLERADILARQVGGVRQNAYVHSVCGENGEVVRVRRDDELSNIVGHRRLDGLWGGCKQLHHG